REVLGAVPLAREGLHLRFAEAAQAVLQRAVALGEIEVHAANAYSCDARGGPEPERPGNLSPARARSPHALPERGRGSLRCNIRNRVRSILPARGGETASGRSRGSGSQCVVRSATASAAGL